MAYYFITFYKSLKLKYVLIHSVLRGYYIIHKLKTNIYLIKYMYNVFLEYYLFFRVCKYVLKPWCRHLTRKKIATPGPRTFIGTSKFALIFHSRILLKIVTRKSTFFSIARTYIDCVWRTQGTRDSVTGHSNRTTSTALPRTYTHECRWRRHQLRWRWPC